MLVVFSVLIFKTKRQSQAHFVILFDRQNFAFGFLTGKTLQLTQSRSVVAIILILYLNTTMLSRSGIIKAAASLLSKPSSQTMASAFGSSLARKSSNKNSFVNKNQNSLINGKWQHYYATSSYCIKNLIPFEL